MHGHLRLFLLIQRVLPVSYNMSTKLSKLRLHNLLASVSFLLSFSLMSFSVFAVDYENPPTDFSELGNIIMRVVNTLLMVAGLVLVAMVGYGVVKATLATGDSRALEGAKSTWTYALYGFFIVVGSTAIVVIVTGILGVQMPWDNLVGNFGAAIDGLLKLGECPTCINPPHPT